MLYGMRGTGEKERVQEVLGYGNGMENPRL